MHQSDCPTWLCNEWGVPHDYIYCLTFLVLLVPYVLFWRKLFKTNSESDRSALAWCGLVLFTLITMCIYFGLLAAVASIVPGIGTFVLGICYVVIICSVIPSIITGILAVLLGIGQAFRK